MDYLILAGVVVGIIIFAILAWKLLLVMIGQVTRTVRDAGRPSDDHDLIELGRAALQEMKALQAKSISSQVEPMLAPEPISRSTGRSEAFRHRHQ